MSESLTPNKDLMAAARAALAGKWGGAALATLLYMLAMHIVQFIPLVGVIAIYLIAGPLTLGYFTYSLSLGRDGSPGVGEVFSGFRDFARSLVAYLLMMLFILLWSLLLIIPGILASLSYAMTFFVLADHPDIGAREAIRRSKEMMYGNRWKYFCLGLRFIGWALLCILTLGIGMLWLYPYMMVSYSRFYEEVSGSAAAGPGDLQDLQQAEFPQA